MALQLAAAITSFVISFLIVPVIIKYSLKKNLLDIPGRRKIHKKVTPSLGGIAIFLGFFISCLIWIDFQYWGGDVKFILVALFIVFFIGVRDDLVPLRAIVKLMGQLMAIFLLIALSDIRLKSFYGIFGIHELPLLVSYALTVATIVVITNAFNLIDGIDGLAGSIATIALASFGTWFYLVGDGVFAILCFTLLGGILAFLIFNWDPSEIFMGDTGALVIGMMLAILAIHFIDLNDSLPVNIPYKFRASVATAGCVIMIPLVDTVRIVILRLLKRQSPFQPDKNHVHHALLRLGNTHSRATTILVTTQLMFIVLAVVLYKFSEFTVMLTAVGVSIVLSTLLNRLIVSRL